MNAFIPILLFGVAAWRPAAALAVLAAALPAYLIRFSVFGIPTTLFEVGLYAVTLGMLLASARTRSLRVTLGRGWRTLGPVRWPLVSLVIVAALAAAFSIDTRTAWGAWKAWFADAALFGFLLALVGRSAIVPLVGGAAVGSIGLSIYGLWEYVFAYGGLQDGRLNSVFETANYHAMLVVPIIIGLLGAGWAARRWRPWLWGAAALEIVALALTLSYGGYFGLAAGVLALAAWLRHRRWFVPVLLALVVVVALGLAVIAPTDKFRRLNDFSTRSSVSVRVEIWRAAWLIVREQPLLGVGPNAFETAYREAIPRIVFPPLEWLVAQPHNFLLAVATQTGSLGVMVFSWLLWTFFHQARSRPDPVGATLGAAMIALLVHGLVDTPYFKNDLALVLVSLIVLVQLPRTREL